MKNSGLLTSFFCLSFFLYGCAGNGESSGGGGASGASSQNLPLGPCSTDFADGDYSNQQIRMQMCLLVNKARVENGLEPLTLEPLRNAVAQGHAMDMANNNFGSHTGSDGSSPADRLERAGVTPKAWGENVAWGATNPYSALQWWMNSEGHRANILRPQFKRLGVGYENTRWVQVFTD